MEIVYVFDKNYIPYFELSVQSVLKFNPKAHITVVSPEPLNIKYENIVIPIRRKFKHRDNDRITSTTYLKLYLPSLPYDKILYLDADLLCLGSLNELWKMDCDYICMAESHKFGDIQAKAHGHLKYGLSGVMLMNLKNLRDIKFTQKALIPFKLELPVWCHEESIINHKFYDKIKFIDRKYNYCYHRDYAQPIDNPLILHFPGVEKRYMHYEFCKRGLFI